LSALASEAGAQHQASAAEQSRSRTRSSAQRADLIIVFPATARELAAYTAGLSSDLHSRTRSSRRGRRVDRLPAMPPPEMSGAPCRAAQTSRRSRSRGVHIVEPEEGRLAGGDIGRGRLAAPEGSSRRSERVLARTISPGCRSSSAPADARADRRRPRHRQPQQRQAGIRDRVEANARGREVTLVTTVDLPAPGRLLR
jgi:phosphopantothenoylcysteine decarboxylase/phosphopantothenate--cysteine ligase